VGKKSSHFISQYIAFFEPSLNNDRLHRFYMQDFFRVERGYEQRANQVAATACQKLVKDMHYEARIQAIIQSNVEYRHLKVNKKQARQMRLTREEYMMVNI
jgi:hypothetical protein